MKQKDRLLLHSIIRQLAKQKEKWSLLPGHEKEKPVRVRIEKEWEVKSVCPHIGQQYIIGAYQYNLNTIPKHAYDSVFHP
jgi:hypothetical protein